MKVHIYNLHVTSQLRNNIFRKTEEIHIEDDKEFAETMENSRFDTFK